MMASASAGKRAADVSESDTAAAKKARPASDDGEAAGTDVFEGLPFTAEELAVTTRVMSSLAATPSAYETGGVFKPFRTALAPFLQHAFCLNIRKQAEIGEANRLKKEKKRVEQRRKAQEKALLDKRGLRAARIQTLRSLQ